MRRKIILGLVAVTLIAATGAGVYVWRGSGGAATPRVAAAQVPDVGVVTLAAAEVPLPLQYSGRVAGFRVVEVRAQVGGILLKREYTEGARVTQGDVLFRIDPRTYEASVAHATAQRALAQASVTQSEENYLRVQNLVAQKVSPQKALEDATAARDQARATLQSAEADLRTANLNLEYSVVKAPISGPTSLVSPPEGALIQAQQTLLTTITQTDPAYVVFTITETELRNLQEINRARPVPIRAEDVEVQLQFGDGTILPRTGKVDTRSRTVDPRTGTLEIRAVFPNADSGILPGQFVRVNLLGMAVSNAILIPKPAVSQGPAGPFVYVVDDTDIARPRPVRLDRELPTGWIAADGLKSGERIVVDGVIRVRPGSKVKPVPMPAPVPAPAPAKP